MKPEINTDAQDGIEHSGRFLVASMVWFDIIACTSTATPPKIAYREWLNRGIDLCPLMGCQNWVMMAIGDIACLYQQRLVWDVEETPDEVLEIQQRLEEGIESMKDSTEASSKTFQAYQC